MRQETELTLTKHFSGQRSRDEGPGNVCSDPDLSMAEHRACLCKELERHRVDKTKIHDRVGAKVRMEPTF